MSTDTKYTVKLMNMNEPINLIKINPIMTVYEVFYLLLLILMMNKLASLRVIGITERVISLKHHKIGIFDENLLVQLSRLRAVIFIVYHRKSLFALTV